MENFLSIIVPVYKIKEIYLRECIKSLQNQTLDGYQIIIVDDGSPDNCGEICDEYAKHDSKIKVFHQKNSGVSVARNLGIQMAETEWITFVDPDDWVEPNHVQTLFNAKESYKEADIFFFDYVQEFDGKSVIKHLKKNSGMLDDKWVHDLRLSLFNHLNVNGKILEYEVNTIWDKMYRTSIIKGNGIVFDTKARKGQDLIYNAEVLQLTDKFCYIHEALYHYRYLRDSVTNRFSSKVQYYNEVAFGNFERIIEQYHLPDEYRRAYYAKVSTRVYSTMRLYYFHPKNHRKWTEIKQELNVTLDREPYKTALKKVNYSDLTNDQKMFVFFLKKRFYEFLWLLVNGRLILKKARGAKLKK